MHGTHSGRFGRRAVSRVTFVTGLLILAMVAVGAPSASATIGIESFTTNGTDPQAGGHPIFDLLHP